jgi:hypothetical protein
MDTLQREIVDDRKIRFDAYRGAGIGSLGLLGLGPGIGLSTTGSGGPIVLTRHESPRQSTGSEIESNRTTPITVIANRRTKANGDSPGFRQREWEWRRTHAKILKQFENEWVVLEGEEIIAHGSNAAQVIHEARSRGIRTPYIFFVEPEFDESFKIGL